MSETNHSAKEQPALSRFCHETMPGVLLPHPIEFLGTGHVLIDEIHRHDRRVRGEDGQERSGVLMAGQDFERQTGANNYGEQVGSPLA